MPDGFHITAEETCKSGSCRTFKREQLQEEARKFILRQYGQPETAPDQDRWYGRYGLLTAFIYQLFP